MWEPEPAQGVRARASSARLLLIAAGGGVLLWNAVAISRLGDRVDQLETTPGAVNQSMSAEDDSVLSQEELPGRGNPSRNRTSASGAEDPAAYLRSLKQAPVPPEHVARELDSRMAQEPANPAQERHALQWLQQATVDARGERVPKASGVTASCRGRRCLTTASFANAGDAQTWATHYLLAPGDGPLANARTLVLPAQDGRSVTLQIYHY